MERAGASKQANRWEFLDAARAIAAVMVVFYHALSGASPFLQNWLLRRENLGSVGVHVFFFVSGFIIPVSMEKKSLLEFWRARFFRLFPAYWVAMALTLACAAAGLMTIDPVFFHWAPKVYLLDAAMIALNPRIPQILSVAWTLTIELGFYILCSGLKATGLLPKRLLTAWAAIGVYLLLFAAAALHLYPPHHFKAEQCGLLLAAFVGSVFYEVQTGRLSQRVLYWLVPVLLVVLIVGGHYEAAWAIAIPTRPADLFSPVANYVSWFIGAALFCTLFALRRRNFPKPLLWLGRISYSLYLLHGLVLSVFYDRMLRHVSLPIAALLAFTLCMLLAEVSYRLVETPANRIGHRFSKPRRLAA